MTDPDKAPARDGAPAVKDGGIDASASPVAGDAPSPEEAASTMSGPASPGDPAPVPEREAAAPLGMLAGTAAPLVQIRRLPIPDPEIVPGLTAIGPVPGERKIRDWALVLQSASIWHVIRRSYRGWVLLVNDADYAAASSSIDGYEQENRDWPPPPSTRERLRHPPSLAIPAVFTLLVAFFMITGPSARNSLWFTHGVAVSSQVLGPAPWQAVTALTLHADGAHVLGNAVSGTIFTAAVQRRLGAGGAALAVLVSGALGNLGNAFYYHRWLGHDHASLGASTAVFGAVGLLAATELVLHGVTAARKRSWVELLAPIVGGFALLGTLGSGGGSYEPFGDPAPRVITTDLGAHLFGLLAGMLIGLVVAIPLRRATVAVDIGTGRQGPEVALGSGRPRWWVQATLGGLAAAIVVVCWELALRR